MKRYFVAECNEEGEAISESIFEVSPPVSRLRQTVEAFALGIAIGIGITIIIL